MSVPGFKVKWLAQLAATRLGLSAQALNVHFILLDHYNIRTGRCFPSIRTIAGAARRSERSVRNCLRELEAANALVTLRGCGPNGANMYRIPCLDRQIDAAASEDLYRSDRQDVADKTMNQTKKNPVTGRRSASLCFVEVSRTDTDVLNAWYDWCTRSILNASISDLFVLLESEAGYRLPARMPSTDPAIVQRHKVFFRTVLATEGACLADRSK